MKIMIKIKNIILKHKIISLVVLLALIGFSVFIYKQVIAKDDTVKYVTEKVAQRDINVSVSGTGQVSSLKEVNIAAEVAGDITGVYAKTGEDVKKGELLFSIDNSEAIKNVKTAELSLESAELSLEKMKAPIDELTLLQSENSLIQAQESKQNAESNLIKSYEDGFNNVSNAFIDLSATMTGLNDILFDHDACTYGVQENYSYYASTAGIFDEKAVKYKNDAYNAYQEAKSAYDANLEIYKETTHYSEKDEIEALINQTYETTKAISESIRTANNLIDFYKYTLTNHGGSYSSIATTHLSSLSSYASKSNSHLSSLFSSKNTIINNKASIISADRTIREKELSLEKAKEGTDELEIKIQELAVEQKREDLLEAQKTLAEDYSLKAPFDGIMASVDAIKGDSANSGTIMGSIITNEKIANITLNEVDIAKVKIGQKVNITFDALDDLLIKGEIAEIDTLGTVSQGVVSYNVKISFDTNDERVKSDMSITANIIVQSVEKVLAVSNSAVKTMGGSSYVEVMLDDQTIQKKKVETGITDDVIIEIKSGVNEGDKIVVQTSSPKTATTNNVNNSNRNQTPEMNNFMIR